MKYNSSHSFLKASQDETFPYAQNSGFGEQPAQPQQPQQNRYIDLFSIMIKNQGDKYQNGSYLREQTKEEILALISDRLDQGLPTELKFNPEIATQSDRERLQYDQALFNTYKYKS